jgi:hypothetical protein
MRQQRFIRHEILYEMKNSLPCIVRHTMESGISVVCRFKYQ